MKPLKRHPRPNDPTMKREKYKRPRSFDGKVAATLAMLLSYTLCTFGLATSATTVQQQQPSGPSDIRSIWDKLSDTVEGRLFQLKPFAEPCFAQPFKSSECIQVMNDYRDEGVYP